MPRKRKTKIVYTVYDNKTDFPVIVDGTARECAEVMGLTLAGFYNALTRAGKKNNRWTFLKTPAEQVERESK